MYSKNKGVSRKKWFFVVFNQLKMENKYYITEKTGNSLLRSLIICKGVEFQHSNAPVVIEFGSQTRNSDEI